MARLDVDRLLASCALLLLGLGVVPVLLAPTHFVEDDAWFYLEIARRWSAGEGSTFQGLFPTNGYHPLWMLVALAIALVTGGARGAMLPIAVATSAVLFVAAVAGLHRSLRALGLRTALLGSTFVAACLLGETWYVSEMALNAALQVVALGLVVRVLAPDSSRGEAALLGFVLGLASLARLDDVFLVAAIVVLVAVRRGIPGALIVGAVAALTVAPDVVVNLVAFGHPVPISGTLKSAFPHVDLVGVGDKLGTFGRVAIAAGTAAWLGAATGVLRGPVRDLSLAWGTGALLHAVYVAAFTRHGWTTWWGWYYVTGVIAAGIVLPALLDRLAERHLPSFRPASIGALLAACLAIPVVARTWATAIVVPGWSGMRVASDDVAPTGSLAPLRPEIRFAQALDASLPADARLVVHDFPGILAWYGRRPVVALDALTADWDYLDAVEADGLATELDRLGITHVVVADGPMSLPWLDVVPAADALRIEARSPRSGGAIGAFRLSRSRVFLRSIDVPGGGRRPWAAVWPIEALER